MRKGKRSVEKGNVGRRRDKEKEGKMSVTQ